MDFNKLIFQLKDYGLDGIESCSNRSTKEQLIFYNEIAQNFNLIKTAGTDFHDSSIDILGIEVQEDYLNEFHDKILKKQK